ncbi:MAG: hypothetical protein COA58_15580 [Bacteroidetes bacterium]|nr:MAG: hypothetical protein COA58_15580 [Bacteroidota bacterium]
MQEVKIWIFFTFLILQLLQSCSKDKNDTSIVSNLDRLIELDSNIQKLETDSLRIVTSRGKLKSLATFYERTGYCILKNDTIFILNGIGSFTRRHYSLSIFNDTLDITMGESSCTYSYLHNISNIKLKLNKRTYQVGDTLIGELYCMGTHSWDSMNDIVDTTVLEGKFNYLVRHSDFTRQDLKRENNRLNFFKRAKENPSNMTDLYISDCGFEGLPNELSVFKNLKSLTIYDNNLSNDDLSAISNLDSLRKLELINCQIKKIPSILIRLKNLSELSLLNNDIKEIPKWIGQLSSLKKLELGSNLITQIPHELTLLTNLEMLSIYGYKNRNQINKLPPLFFEKLKHIQSFYPPNCMDSIEYEAYTQREN